MIFKVFPSPADLENLSRVSTEKCSEADSYDYRSVVVNKPWGYEYLWYQNDFVAAWMLHLKAGSATSLHCHVRKRTSLILIEGRVVCSTLEDRFRLSKLDCVVLEPGVFHSTQAISPEGAFVLEIETPVMKGDLVRLKDRFGRQGTGYEGASQYSKEFSKYDYQPFAATDELKPTQFKNLSFLLLTEKTGFSEHVEESGLIVPMSEVLAENEKIVADTAEASPAEKILPFLKTLKKKTELLYIR